MYLTDYVFFFQTTNNGNGDYTFVCQHGDRECEGNKMHACALKHLPAASREAFINCSMSSASPPEAGPNCANSLGLNFTPVQECIRTEGPALLAANGNRTHSLDPALYYVPWILYNGDFTVEDLTDSQSDFLTTLCKKLGSSGPSVCNNNAVKRKNPSSANGGASVRANRFFRLLIVASVLVSVSILFL